MNQWQTAGRSPEICLRFAGEGGGTFRAPVFNKVPIIKIKNKNRAVIGRRPKIMPCGVSGELSFDFLKMTKKKVLEIKIASNMNIFFPPPANGADFDFDLWRFVNKGP